MNRRRAAAVLGVGVVIVIALAIGFAIGRTGREGGPDPQATAPPKLPPTSTSTAPMPTIRPPDTEPDLDELPTFPNAATTGVPEGYELRQVRADPNWVVTEDVDGIEFTGMIVIGAPGVKITNSRIYANTEIFGIWNREGHEGTVVESSEIICVGDPKPTAAAVANIATVRNNDIWGCADGIKIGGDTLVEGNYIHDLAIAPGTHNDGIQMQGGSNVVITGNTIVMVDDGRSQANAAVFIQDDSTPIANVEITENYVNGFGFTLRLNGAGVRNSAIVDNVIGRDHLFGPLLISNGAEGAANNNTSRGNSYLDGAKID